MPVRDGTSRLSVERQGASSERRGFQHKVSDEPSPAPQLFPVTCNLLPVPIPQTETPKDAVCCII